MKQAFVFLASVALSQYCIGSDASGGNGRHHRLPQGDAFLETSSSLKTTMLWSRVHSAEALAETEREALVAQQEALKALQKEQEALAAKEARMETKLEKLQRSPKAPQMDSRAPPYAPPMLASHSQEVTRGVEFAIEKRHSGHRAHRGSGHRQGLASLWGRWKHSAHNSPPRTNGVSFLGKRSAHKHQAPRMESAQDDISHHVASPSGFDHGPLPGDYHFPSGDDSHSAGLSTLSESNRLAISGAETSEDTTTTTPQSKKDKFWESVEDSLGLPTSTSYGRRLWGNIATCGFLVVQAFICGVVYEQCCKVSYPFVDDSKVHHDEWQFGLFECRGSRDWRIWLCACCCPSVRWADTVSRLQFPIMGFLPALFVFSLLEGATGLTFGVSGVILFLVVVLSRLRIREEYGIVHGECGILGDCLIWCFCGPCAIVQEARQVEYVKPLVFEEY